MKPMKIKTKICDAYSEKKDITATVEITAQGIDIRIKGYGTASECGDNGSIILIENRHGKPAVVCWSDIMQEDPTHTIEFEDAKASKRPKDE